MTEPTRPSEMEIAAVLAQHLPILRAFAEPSVVSAIKRAAAPAVQAVPHGSEGGTTREMTQIIIAIRDCCNSYNGMAEQPHVAGLGAESQAPSAAADLQRRRQEQRGDTTDASQLAPHYVRRLFQGTDDEDAWHVVQIDSVEYDPGQLWGVHKLKARARDQHNVIIVKFYEQFHHLFHGDTSKDLPVIVRVLKATFNNESDDPERRSFLLCKGVQVVTDTAPVINNEVVEYAGAAVAEDAPESVTVGMAPNAEGPGGVLLQALDECRCRGQYCNKRGQQPGCLVALHPGGLPLWFEPGVRNCQFLHDEYAEVEATEWPNHVRRFVTYYYIATNWYGVSGQGNRIKLPPCIVQACRAMHPATTTDNPYTDYNWEQGMDFPLLPMPLHGWNA